MCVFQRKTGHISETVRDRAKVNIIITNRKCYTPCHMRWKLSILAEVEGQYALLWLNGAR